MLRVEEVEEWRGEGKKFEVCLPRGGAYDGGKGFVIVRPASCVVRLNKEHSPPLSSCLFILSFTPCNSCTMVSSTTNLTLFLGIILFVSVSAFSGLPTVQKNYANVQKRVPNKQIMSPPRSTTQLNIFGNAFANDDTLGKRDNPGLKKVTVHDYMI